MKKLLATLVVLSLAPAPPDRGAADSEAEEVALYQQVMRDEELDKKTARKQASEEKEEDSEPALWHPKKLPPPGLYRAGLVPFFLNVDLLMRWFGLAVLIFLAIFVTAKAKGQIDTPNLGMASFGAWFVITKRTIWRSSPMLAAAKSWRPGPWPDGGKARRRRVRVQGRRPPGSSVPDEGRQAVHGAGHAGCEAALASARMGRATLLISGALGIVEPSAWRAKCIYNRTAAYQLSGRA